MKERLRRPNRHEFWRCGEKEHALHLGENGKRLDMTKSPTETEVNTKPMKKKSPNEVQKELNETQWID